MDALRILGVEGDLISVAANFVCYRFRRYERIRQRVIRINDPNCHAESPKSRTRRMISNVRILEVDGDLVTVAANFVCYRFRRYERIREYVGSYRYQLRRTGDSFRIKERRVLIDAHELGNLGSVSFIL